MNYRNSSRTHRPILTIIPHGATTERELAYQTLNSDGFQSSEVIQILCDGPLRVCDRTSRLPGGSRALTTCARCIAEQGSGFPTLLMSNFLSASVLRAIGSYLLTASEALHTTPSAHLPPFDGVDTTPFIRSPLADRFPDLLEEASTDEGLRSFLIARGITLETSNSAPATLHPDRLPRLEASLLCLCAIRSILTTWQPAAILIFGSASLITTATVKAASLEGVPSIVISMTAEGAFTTQTRDNRAYTDGPSLPSDMRPIPERGLPETFSRDHFSDKDHLATGLACILRAQGDEVSVPGATTAVSC